MNELETRPCAVDPTSGRYVVLDSVAVGAADESRAGPKLPRGVLIGQPAAVRLQRRIAAVVVLLLPTLPVVVPTSVLVTLVVRAAGGHVRRLLLGTPPHSMRMVPTAAPDGMQEDHRRRQ